jgi:hypothetical protein
MYTGLSDTTEKFMGQKTIFLAGEMIGVSKRSGYLTSVNVTEGGRAASKEVERKP